MCFDPSGPIQGLSDRLPAGHKSEPGGAMMGPGLKAEPPQPSQQLVYVFTTSLANRWGWPAFHSINKRNSSIPSQQQQRPIDLLLLSAAPQRPWWKARPTPSFSFTSRTFHSPSWSRSDTGDDKNTSNRRRVKVLEGLLTVGKMIWLFLSLVPLCSCFTSTLHRTTLKTDRKPDFYLFLKKWRKGNHVARHRYKHS